VPPQSWGERLFRSIADYFAPLKQHKVSSFTTRLAQVVR